MVDYYMVEELHKIYESDGDIYIKAYYKYFKGEKKYYDFQSLNDAERLNGSYDQIFVQELIFFLDENSKQYHIGYYTDI